MLNEELNIEILEEALKEQKEKINKFESKIFSALKGEIDIEAILRKVIEVGTLSYDDITYKAESFKNINVEEYSAVVEAIMIYANSIGKLYNEMEYNPKRHFPTDTCNLMFDGELLCVEHIYGQGTCTHISARFSNNEIPYFTFDEFKEGAKKLVYKRELEEYNENLKESLQKAKDGLLQLKEMLTNESELHAEIEKSIENLEKEIEKITS